MNSLLPLAAIGIMLYVFWRFGYQEERSEPYEEAILDVQGRLEWARSRQTPLPPGMESQLQRTSQLLDEAKELWSTNKWDKALKKAWEAQTAMNTAQEIFVQALNAKRGILWTIPKN